jgi:hypothetical protein
MHSRMAAIAQIVAVVHVVHVNVVSLIPVRRPGFGPGIDNGEPEAAVLEAWTSIDHDHGCSVNAEVVSTAKVLAEAVWRNAITYITSAIMPRAVFASPIPCTLTRPHIVGWRMRGIVPVIASMFVGSPVLRLMRIWPVSLLVLRRSHIPVFLGPRCLVVVHVLRLTLVAVVVSSIVALLMLGTAVMVIIMPVLCVSRSTCS